jgi:quercetin dioxygenase-like cupin family protein
MGTAAAHKRSYEPGDREKFTGKVWFLRKHLAKDGTGMVVVHFSVGARTNWHIHPAGQLIVVQSGRVVPRGGEGQILSLCPGTLSTPLRRMSTITGAGPTARWHT